MTSAVPDALLTLLRWCLLALIYLFFFRVLQATWHGAGASTRKGGTRLGERSNRGAKQAAPAVGVGAGAGGSSTPAPASSLPTPQTRSGPSRLVVVEPTDQAGTLHVVNDELTIGRAAGCEITLDDTYISQLHARLFKSESGLVVEDLGSTNGTYLNRQRVTAPVVVSPGDRIQVGSIVMELQ